MNLPIRLTLYSRPGCHLCDEMKAIVVRVGVSVPLLLDEIDISTDERLEELYGLEIPVLMVEGKKVAKYRISETELQRVLAGRAAESTGQRAESTGRAESKGQRA